MSETIGHSAWRRAWPMMWRVLRPLDPFRSVKAALGWLVIVSIGITTLLTLLAYRSDIELQVIAIIAIIASLLVTQFVAQSLAAPVLEMTDAARGMARGDYGRRVRVTRRDELGDLALAFNRMAADLQAVDRHRKELIANVSHELRTPIAGLRAVLENVVDGVCDADPATMATALRQTERLGRLVEQLLDLSRLENGVVPLHPRRFDVEPYLSAVLNDANVALRRGHARNDVRFRLDVTPGTLHAHADPERLDQVVTNLVDNAVKHSPQGGQVTVVARPGQQPGGLVLEVLDEGPGIPQSQRQLVFERFGRGTTNGVTPRDGGTGLGLAIARWAVDLHGGTIGVEESRRGCRIRLTLPGNAKANI
ncbi:HAMP domain-containing sensor histidine kinase [Streptomyces sp. DSM 44917]|uniref:Signal transduction histidine-protein kinase/phosphatase MprB n=1 Tax=Streptomyces boetiae TaxID=3075541 RepID=A0ABU2L9R7_9ACTN|nr:HAMP domain-containing sensor histidine kinase [Streptomyces sp. DSM 44917]MDT0308313.1 HAMP domain-containing sensor histidine kinase [Streptomyces sp. DSM 44917]